MSVASMFDSLKIWLSETNSATLYAHATEIKTRLTTSFGLKNYEYLGSHVRGTAIRAYSDLDLMAIYPKETATWGGSLVSSETLLRWTREDLAKRYTQTVLGKDGQAVRVDFSDGTVDVVPAIFKGIHQTYSKPIYIIPNGVGGWLETCPKAHDKSIEDAHATSGNKFRFLIQFFKYWRLCRTSHINFNSFHLELLFSSNKTFGAFGTYSRCMYDGFSLLHQRQCRALQDPLGISGSVLACSSEAKKQAAIAAVATSKDWAEKALAYEKKGDIANAKYYWKLVFNNGI